MAERQNRWVATRQQVREAETLPEVVADQHGWYRLHLPMSTEAAMVGGRERHDFAGQG